MATPVSVAKMIIAAMQHLMQLEKLEGEQLILNISIGRTSKQWKENLKVNSCTLLRRYLCFHLSAQPVFDSV